MFIIQVVLEILFIDVHLYLYSGYFIAVGSSVFPKQTSTMLGFIGLTM